MIAAFVLALGLAAGAATPNAMSGEAMRQPGSQSSVRLPADNRTLLSKVLTALPEAGVAAQSDNWRQLANEAVLAELDGARTTITSTIAAMDRDAALSDFRDLPKLETILAAPSITLDSSTLSGRWLCRTVLATDFGVFAYPYFQCAIHDRGQCLELTKINGSQRFAGCLRRIDSRYLAFVGKWQTDFEERPTGGFLSSTHPAHLRMIVPSSARYFTVYEFKRGTIG